MNEPIEAPGKPGITPRWTSSAKSGVGTACNSTSRVWFTIGYGILDEIYYPTVDWACVRDMGLIVTDGGSFFSEEKRHTHSQLTYLAEGVPAYHLANTCDQGRYRIEKDIIADPQRSVVLQRIRFVPLQGKLEDYHLYALLAPHLGNRGYENSAWVGDYKGMPMVFAERENEALALACSSAWLQSSVGFVGSSDGWQDLSDHGQMTWHYTSAADGNVAATAEIDLLATKGEFVIAIALESRGLSAGHLARASLLDGFDIALETYIAQWQAWQNPLAALDETSSGKSNLYRVSTAVLQTHEAKQFAGGLIASLSIPWGTSKGDDDLGGYHLVWTRDLVETVGGLMAANARETALRVLHYLQVTQELDGHWVQNMWLDGTPYWKGTQLDEVGFPILLTEQAWRRGSLPDHELDRLWPMVRAAASFIVCHGPVSDQDRWEENPGYSPFTLAVEISALLAAAELADTSNEPELARYLRETADLWNDSIERWTYVIGTELADHCGVEGYYVRIAPPETLSSESLKHNDILLRNRPAGRNLFRAADIISPDALALVRFGLRSPQDPRILNTIKVIDSLLKIETPLGSGWHRYNNDGYGEHEDGCPYDGTGIGRLWPLLTGERAHYELAAGNEEEAHRLLHVMEAFASEGGLLPEQVWDAPDIPEHGLYLGRPSGSAMPLVWAHAEYIKLLHSLREGRVFDMPLYTEKRYLVEHIHSSHFLWRFNHKTQHIPQGMCLRIEVLAAACVRWSLDNWQTSQETETLTTQLGVYYVDLPTEKLSQSSKIAFTFCWTKDKTWENTNFEVCVE